MGKELGYGDEKEDEYFDEYEPPTFKKMMKLDNNQMANIVKNRLVKSEDEDELKEDYREEGVIFDHEPVPIHRHQKSLETQTEENYHMEGVGRRNEELRRGITEEDVMDIIRRREDEVNNRMDEMSDVSEYSNVFMRPNQIVEEEVREKKLSRFVPNLFKRKEGVRSEEMEMGSPEKFSLMERFRGHKEDEDEEDEKRREEEDEEDIKLSNYDRAMNRYHEYGSFRNTELKNLNMEEMVRLNNHLSTMHNEDKREKIDKETLKVLTKRIIKDNDLYD